MDATTQALIADLISRKMIQNWPFWVLFFVISFASGVLVNFVRAYATKRGEQLATREDFENLKSQLEKTTRLTEQIKSEVGHIEWRMRETYTTRRAKLEEFVQQIGTVASTHSEWVSSMLHNDEFKPLDTECSNRLEMLARLYFPTLYVPTIEFTTAWGEISQHALAAAQGRLQIDRNDLQGRQRQMEAAVEAYRPLYQQALARRSALEKTVVTTMGDVLQFSDELQGSGPATE